MRGLQLNEQTVQPARKRQKTASLSQQSVATPSSAERSPPEPLSDQDKIKQLPFTQSLLYTTHQGF